MSFLEHMTEQLEFESKLNNINRIEKLIDEVVERCREVLAQVRDDA